MGNLDSCCTANDEKSSELVDGARVISPTDRRTEPKAVVIKED